MNQRACNRFYTAASQTIALRYEQKIINSLQNLQMLNNCNDCFDRYSQHKLLQKMKKRFACSLTH